ncbi:MAG: hypothetical protein JHD02_07630 [Thermoleophilaceae bacterium]|nr:hypothetical protein [Thermoleophilaceae bacterium]
MRAVRFVRLIVILAVLGSAMTFCASSAWAFTLSSSTATTQAGAPTDLSFTYVAKGTQTLTSIYVDLPPGMMHDPSSTPACPVADFKADRCQTPRSGHTTTVINVAGANVSVQGDIYPISDPADDSEFSLGIVLRPPLSALGLTGKIYLRDRVSFTNGGGLRHSISGANFGVSVLGVSVRSRIQRMSLNFTGRNSTANQLYNSTSCREQRFQAQGTFADGTNESRTSPYTAVGCDKLIFTGGFEFRDSTTKATQPKSFGAKLGSGARAPAGVTHEYHRVGAKIDLSGIGDWDDTALISGPSCTAAEVSTSTCPERAQLGRLSVGIEGFPGTMSGAIYNSYPRGAKPRAAIRLSQNAVALFTVDLVTGADGRSSFVVDGLPQLPLTDLNIDIDAPVFVAKGKPASCSAREARGVILGHNGGQTNTTAKYPAIPCPPSVSTVDPRDDDSDGDGFADDELRHWNFHVWTQVADGGNGIDESSARCDLESPDAARAAVRGKVKSVRDMGSGYFGCEVTNAAGPVTVVFSIASRDGHVTVLKRSYTVDSEAPVVQLSSPGELVFDSPQVEVEFDVTDDTLTHPQSEITAEAELSTGQVSRAKVVTDRDSGRSKGFARFESVPDGDHELTLSVSDSTGHVTVLKAAITVDTEGPVITLLSLPGTVFRDQDFSVSLSASDAISGVDEGRLECSLTSENDPTLAILFGSIEKLADGSFSCGFNDAPPGPGLVSLTAYDYRGHVTVLKHSVIVDGSPPVVDVAARRFHVQESIDAQMDFEISDDSLYYPQGEVTVECERKGWDGSVKGSAKIVTDRDTGRSKGVCVFENVPDGSYKVSVRGWDPVRKEGIDEGELIVDRSPPEITLTNPEDADSNDDGIADRRFRLSFFDVFTEIVDLGSGVDPAATSCLAKVVNKGVVKGNIIVMQADRVVCSLEGLPDGDVEVEITARNYVGTVTIVKRGFTVDTLPPEMRFVDTGDLDSDGNGFADNRFRPAFFDIFTEVSDLGSGVDPSSGECSVTLRKGGVVKGNITIINGNLRCSFSDLPDGDADIEISAADYRGHVTVLKAAVTVGDPPPPADPVLTILAPSEGQPIIKGSALGVLFSIDGTGPFTFRCAIDNVIVSQNCVSGTSINTSGMGLGAHDLKVIADDAAGSYEAIRSFDIVPSSDGGVITFP